MQFQENETVELKEIVTADLKKEIIAFANCSGGKIYIGVRDDGTVAGLDDPDGVALQVSNMVRDSIKPDMTMFMHYETVEECGKKLVAIEVQRGTARPYYIAGKGMRPEGVYVRQGYSSVPATDTAIRNMIKETDGDRFEAMRSLNQELSFEAAKHEFHLRNVEFGIQQMRTLKLFDRDGLYSNLALLLSDQCAHTVKVAIFQGNNQAVFKDRKEFSGSLMRQMNEIYKFIKFRNGTKATFDELYRIDTKDYPEAAVREAMLNLLVHRDYSNSTSAFIRMFENRLEFLSIGGLMPGITLRDIMIGVSACRNQDLANVFYRLHLIEAYGTGIEKIFQAYDGHIKKPSIEVTDNAFKVILPNVNADPDDQREDLQQTAHKSSNEAVITLGQKVAKDRESAVLTFAAEHNGTVRRSQVEELLDVSTSTAARLLRRMVSRKLLKPRGRAQSIEYMALKRL